MNYSHSILRLLSFFLLHVSLGISYTPQTILLSCGSSAGNVTTNGRNWGGDIGSKFGPMEPSYQKSRAAKPLSQGRFVDSVPYMTARISRSSFSYSFPVTPGQKFIRLHFYPTKYQGGFYKYKDFFNVVAGPHTLLRNFSASFYADYWGTATFFREYAVNVDEGQQLNMTFSPFLGDSNDSYAFINGIEIVSMPSNLYYTPPGDDHGLNIVGQNGKFHVQNDTALQNACRLNVGGISLKLETDMYREWREDDDYFVYHIGGVITRFPRISLNYSKIPPYTAPADVYRSARTMGINNTTGNLLKNLTWLVPVHHGFNYLVRLHFCEIVPEMTDVNDRRFIVSIDGKVVESGFDVIESSGGSKVPIYKDYIVSVGASGDTNDYHLSITLHPNSSSLYKDVILNGLEVFKLSDSRGNLAGPNTPPPGNVTLPRPVKLSKSNSTNNRTWVIVAVVASVVGLLIIISLISCLVIWRLRKTNRYLIMSH